MKKLIWIVSLAALLAGCAWIEPNRDGKEASSGSIPGDNSSPARGTTGVSSGADAGTDVTGSDLAPR